MYLPAVYESEKSNTLVEKMLGSACLSCSTDNKVDHGLRRASDDLRQDGLRVMERFGIEGFRTQQRCVNC